MIRLDSDAPFINGSKAKMIHENKGAEDLNLIVSRSASVRIERGQDRMDDIKIQKLDLEQSGIERIKLQASDIRSRENLDTIRERRNKFIMRR